MYHLHIRGENMTTQHGLKLLKGSPPHTWRKLVPGGAQTHNNRITSTYVEKIMLKSGDITQSQDHLHIRGENSKFIHLLDHLPGSPPHTWRKSERRTFNFKFRRITSTYVEKMQNQQTHQLLILGSPPHTWRKSCFITIRRIKLRITSTYVEKIDWRGSIR